MTKDVEIVVASFGSKQTCRFVGNTSDSSGKVLYALFGTIAFKQVVVLASPDSEMQEQAERQEHKPFKTVSLGRQQSFPPPSSLPLCGVFVRAVINVQVCLISHHSSWRAWIVATEDTE